MSAKLKPSHTVECPHCGHQFQLNQMNDLAVPELKVVEGDAHSTGQTSTLVGGAAIPIVDRDLYDEQGNARKKYKVPPQLAKGAKRGRNRSRRKLNARFEPRIEPSVETNADISKAHDVKAEKDSKTGQIGQQPWLPADSSDSIPEFTRQSGLAIDSQADRANLRDPQHPSRHLHRSTTNRRRRRRPSSSSSSGLMETIKVVLGGLLAVPLAYLIVMWFLGQDPLRIAPSIQHYVPFAVPPKMRIEPNRDVNPVSESEDSSSDALPQDESESDRFNVLDNLQFPDFYEYPNLQPSPESDIPRE